VVRSREYLTPHEVEALAAAASSTGRHQLRDRTLVLISYRHALRISELVSLRWDQIDFVNKVVYINRMKHGVPSVHPLQADTCSALGILKKQ
jgi:integrase